MARQDRRRRGDTPALQKTLLSWTDLGIRLTLLVQLTMTALLFSARHSNPDAHKELHGALLGAMAFGLYLLRLALTQDWKVLRSAYIPPMVCFSAWCVIRAFTSPTAESHHVVTIFLGMLVAYPVWAQQLKDATFRTLLQWSVVMLGALMAAGALVESFGFYPLTLISQYERQSIGSWLGHNNPMAAFLLVASVHGATLWWRHRDRSWSAVFIGVLLLNLYLILLSGSRGVWLSMIAVVVLLGVSLYLATGGQLSRLVPQRVLYGLGIVLFLFVGVVGIRALMAGDDVRKDTAILSRFAGVRETFAGTYPRVWWMSIQMFKDHPIAGVGFNAWHLDYPDQQGEWFTNNPGTHLGLPKRGQHTLRAHNDYLQLVAELGIVGLGLLFWIATVHLKRAWRFVRNTDEWEPSRMAGLVAMTGTLVQALIFFPFHHAASSALFIANLALFAVPAPAGGIPPPARTDRWRAILGSVLLVVLTIATLVFWFHLFRGFDTRGRGVGAVVLLLAILGIGPGLLALVSPKASGSTSSRRLAPVSVWVAATGLVAALLFISVSGAWFGRLASADRRMGIGRTYKSVLYNESWKRKNNNMSTAQILVNATTNLEKGLAILPAHADAGHMRAELTYLYAREVADPAAYHAAIAAHEFSYHTYRFYESERRLAQCHHILYRTYRDEDDSQRAEEHYRKALHHLQRSYFIYPFDFEIIEELGLLQNEHGDTMDALAHYQQAYLRYQSVEPNLAAHLYTSGLQARNAGYAEKAQFLLSSAYTLEQQNEVYVNGIMDLYMQMGRPDLALTIAQGYLMDEPGEAGILRKVFKPLIDGGDHKAAKDGIRQVVHSVGETPPEGWVPLAVVQAVASIYVENGDHAEARALCDAALEMLTEGAERDAVASYRDGIDAGG